MDIKQIYYQKHYQVKFNIIFFIVIRFSLDVKSISPVSPQKSNEKISDSSPKKATSTQIEPLQLNTVIDQSYRINDARRDEAVNTINSTFRR